MGDQPTCEQRVRPALDRTLESLQSLWALYQEDCEAYNDDGNLATYHLSFDYVPEGTFDDQEEGYFRYQLSWGGPSDEFRFFVGPGFHPPRVEYWFLDWFDGASRRLHGAERELLEDIFQWFKDCGSVTHAYEEATADEV